MKKLNLPLDVPTTRVDPDSAYTLHGRRFDDPYASLHTSD
jgi:prolyl oligopeptidase